VNAEIKDEVCFEARIRETRYGWSIMVWEVEKGLQACTDYFKSTWIPKFADPDKKAEVLAKRIKRKVLRDRAQVQFEERDERICL
jgi:hypothetical protein